jgi:hypothetical protein
LRDQLREKKDDYWSEQVDIQARNVTAWTQLAAERQDEALKRIRRRFDTFDYQSAGLDRDPFGHDANSLSMRRERLCRNALTSWGWTARIECQIGSEPRLHAEKKGRCPHRPF